MFEKWQKLIQHVWATIVYWELFRQYCRDRPEGSFFALTWFAVRDKLFLEISRVVTICEQIATQVDVGREGKRILEELKALYAKGELNDRSALNFEDCGVKVFRDKAIAHPANPIQAILGKPEYKIEVKWNTIKETIDKIRQFCEAVEQHHANDWQTTHYLGETGDGANALKTVLHYIELANKYDKLEHEVVKLGKPRISYDWNKKEFVIEKE